MNTSSNAFSPGLNPYSPGHNMLGSVRNTINSPYSRINSPGYSIGGLYSPGNALNIVNINSPSHIMNNIPISPKYGINSPYKSTLQSQGYKMQSPNYNTMNNYSPL